MRLPTSLSSSWIVTPDKFLTQEVVTVLRQSMEQRRARATSCGDRRTVRNAGIVETLLGTGLRVSELCALIVGDLFVDGPNPQLLVRHGKGGKRRLVAVSTTLALYLQGYLLWLEAESKKLAPEQPLFRARDGHITRSAVHRVWKEALEAAGLPTRWGVHATRHSYAVEVYRRTKDLRLTQRLLGHSSPTVTMVYASLLDDDVRRGVEAVWS
jgi:site-specific recombinase XerD